MSTQRLSQTKYNGSSNKVTIEEVFFQRATIAQKNAFIQKGFSLIEFIITMVIVLAVAMIAIPGHSEVIKKKRVASAAETIRGAFSLARTKAVTTQEIVRVCTKHADSSECDVDAKWSDGWIVFQDLNNNSKFDSDQEVLFQSHQGFGADIKVVESIGNNVIFSGDGMANIESTELIVVCNNSGMPEEESVIGVALYITGKSASAADLTEGQKNSCLG